MAGKGKFVLTTEHNQLLDITRVSVVPNQVLHVHFYLLVDAIRCIQTQLPGEKHDNSSSASNC